MFIGSWGNRKAKEEMKSGWPGYFKWFCRIQMAERLECKNQVGILSTPVESCGEGELLRASDSLKDRCG